jgi:Mycobacterium 19 kDa lipoprotein antigen
MQKLIAVVGTALVLVAAVSGCSQAETRSQKAARVTIDGNTRMARPPACSQLQSYWTINIPDHGGSLEAVVLLSADKTIPKWVKIRNFDGFTGSFWEGGVGEAHADYARHAFTITGSAFGVHSSKPNNFTTADFKIAAEC